MPYRRLKSVVARAVVVLSAPVLLGSTGLTVNFEQRVLAAHNRERAAVGVAPLAWNGALAADAKAWADHLAATGGFHHAPETSADPQGENLWAGTTGAYSAEAMVDAWVREKRYFKQGLFPDNSTTGDVSDIGHYTQLMWRETGEVGCAKATARHEEILVCRYSDAGNYIGERPF